MSPVPPIESHRSCSSRGAAARLLVWNEVDYRLTHGVHGVVSLVTLPGTTTRFCFDSTFISHLAQNEPAGFGSAFNLFCCFIARDRMHKPRPGLPAAHCRPHTQKQTLSTFALITQGGSHSERGSRHAAKNKKDSQTSSVSGKVQASICCEAHFHLKEVLFAKHLWRILAFISNEQFLSQQL